MSYRGDDSSIPDRVRVDYAPTGRASCKACRGPIPQDSVRVGIKVRSPFHDGFDMHYHHADCGLRAAASPDAIKGFERLRWADQLALAATLHCPPCDAADGTDVGAVRALNAAMWALKDRLSAVPKKALVEALEANRRFTHEKTSPAELAHSVADGLLCGILPPCPWCQCEAVHREGGKLRCAGFASGMTACMYTATLVSVFGASAAPTADPPAPVRAFAPTPALERALKGWGLPADAPARAVGGWAGPAAPPPKGAANGGGQAKAAAAPTGGGKAVVPTGGKGKGGKGTGGKETVVLLDSSDEEAPAGGAPESEDEEDVPAGREMAGMSFASVGSVVPAAADLKELVEAHGGEWVSGGVGDGSVLTHLVSTAAEARKPAGKRAAKYAAALAAGVPVVSTAYVQALAGVADGGGGGGGGGGKRGKKRAAEASGAPIDLVREEEEAAAGARADLDIDRLKVAELRAQLASRSLPTGGAKRELVARLRAALDGADSGDSSDSGSGDSADVPLGRKRPRPEEAGAEPPTLARSGSSLRQRKHMKEYLLDGGVGAPLPPVRSIAARPPPAARPGPKEAAARVRLPPIAPGSQLLRVDEEANRPTSRIYVDSYNLAYHAVLNVVDLAAGTNKFYRMQLLRVGKTGDRFAVYKAWGRIGADGGAGAKSGKKKSKSKSGRSGTGGSLVNDHDTDLDGATREFHAKFRELTRDDFVTCAPPSQLPGGYAVALIPGQIGADAAERGGVSRPACAGGTRPCSLPPSVARFVETIFSNTMMQAEPARRCR